MGLCVYIMDTVSGEGNKLENMSIGFCWMLPMSGFITLVSKSLPIRRWQKLPCACPLRQIHRFQSQNQDLGSVISKFSKNKSFFLVSEYFVEPMTPDNFIIS